MSQTFKIIPAIDIIDGKCVRLTQGDYNTTKIYNSDPVEVAKEFEDAGIQYLHLVDLDGAKSKHIVNQKVLESIASQTNLSIDFGGGIKSDQDIMTAINSGAQQVTCGSISVSDPARVKKWIIDYGAEKIILGADCKDRKIATHGWLNESNLDVISHIQNYQNKGIQDVICTDIAKDGMLQGASLSLYQDIISKTDINLIASGGISSIEDVIATKEIGCTGVIIGKAIYEGYISLSELTALC